MLRSKQRLYGVPNSEFSRYAAYCTRRENRLRRLLKLPGKNREDLGPQVCQNKEHIEIICLIADGAWARYRQLKPSSTENLQHRAHSLRRLRKCQTWWKLAKDCAAAFADESTQVEIDVFATFAKASLELENGQWKSALEDFTNVVAVLNEMSAHSQNESFKTHCTGMIDDIDPLLSFCKFNIGDNFDHEADASVRAKVRDVFSLGSSAAPQRKLTELKWRTHSIPIVQDTLQIQLAQIVDLIAEAQQTTTAEGPLTRLDRLIAESHSCRQNVQSLLKKTESPDLHLIDEFLRFKQFIAILDRSRAVLFTLKTDREKIELADRIYHKILDIIPQFEGDPAIDALGKIWHSIKLSSIAKIRKGTAEEVVLFEKAKDLLSEAIGRIKSDHVSDPPGLEEWSNSLFIEVRTLKIGAVAGLNGVQVKTTEKAFLDDLDSFDPCRTLVQVPPQPRLVTPKPILYDIAHDFLEYPNLEGKLKKTGWSKLKFW